MTHPTLTAHCLVKNEENFVGFAIRSVIDYVDQMIVFDTGSTDKTVVIIEELAKQYPDKIIFEEKGPCDKIRHTQLRQEMLERTTTDWFMVLDGDEVWTKRGMEEACALIREQSDLIFIAVDIYLPVGDIFHDHNRKLVEKINGIKSLELTRFYRKQPGLNWQGAFGEWLYNNEGKLVWYDPSQGKSLKNRFWHMTHLERSSLDGNDYTSNSNTETRAAKRRNTYFIIGTKIHEPVPEVFDSTYIAHHTLGVFRSFINFFPYLYRQLKKRFKL